jgi:hypothetical protein
MVVVFLPTFSITERPTPLPDERIQVSFSRSAPGLSSQESNGIQLRGDWPGVRFGVGQQLAMG